MICELESGVREQIEESLKDVIDPELGVNVVDLGLVHGDDPRGPQEIARALRRARRDVHRRCARRGVGARIGGR